MKKILILICCTLFSLSFSQNIEELKEKTTKAMDNNDFVTAKSYLNKIIENGHKTWGAYLYLGECELKLGNYKEALTNFEIAESKENVEDFPAIYLRKGLALMELEEYEKAWNEFIKVEKSEPDNPAIKKMQASALYFMNKYDDALLALNKAEKLDDKDTEIMFSKAIILLKQNKTAEGCKNLEQSKALGIPDLQLLDEQYCKKTK